MNSRIIFIAPFVILLQSCDILAPTDPGPGTGVINVRIDSVYYDVTNVGGGEDMGCFCGGKLLGKSFSLALGQRPKIGDTLVFGPNNRSTFYPIYALYDDNYAIANSGSIIITDKYWDQLVGTFSFKVVSGKDTLNFTDGYFSVAFVPARD